MNSEFDSALDYRIYPLGDNALTVEFGNCISAEINNRVLSCAHYFEKNPFQGLVEIVPAYASLSFFYDVLLVRKKFPEFPTAFEAVKNFAEKTLRNAKNYKESESHLIKIPVCFDEDYALDLKFVAAANNLSAEKVIEIFLAPVYRVYMLGFTPGFSYMGEVDERIAAPRKNSPRLQVPEGSVGIAGRQTGIYSLESPGGWQIIGRTNIKLFTPNEKNPIFLQAGDSVKFYKTNF